MYLDQARIFSHDVNNNDVDNFTSLCTNLTSALTHLVMLYQEICYRW